MSDDTWVLMTERHPPYAAEYLVYGRLDVGHFPLSVFVGYYCASGRWRLAGTNQQLSTVTHWMPKPDGPKEEEAKDAGD